MKRTHAEKWKQANKVSHIGCVLAVLCGGCIGVVIGWLVAFLMGK